MSCGACCAIFRVNLTPADVDPERGGRVPITLTEPLRSNELAMRGTSSAQSRCVALDADIGRYSRCTIYELRSVTCKSVTASYEHGVRDAKCDIARKTHGLPLLTPNDWLIE